MKLSFIIPVLNESKNIETILKQLQPYQENRHEVIVVDGGSRDNTIDSVSSLPVKLLISKPGRAMQMNIGAEQADGEVLVFLHADTQLPSNAPDLIVKTISQGCRWGRFNVRLSGRHVLFRIIETMMNLRSCVTSIATGDQVIFVQRSVFEKVGGYSEIKLMEDIDLSKRLKYFGRAACVKARVTTSSRKWEQNGILKTVWLMWRLRLFYYFGVSPDKLFSKYYQ